MTTFSASLTNLMVLLPQSRDSSCYVSRPILAPPQLWLQKHTDLRAYDFAHCPALWLQSRLANVTCVWSWRLCGINPVIHDASSRGILLTTGWTTLHYNSITSTKSPSFCMTTFTASLTNLKSLLPQPRDSSCYVSGPILAPPSFRLQNHTDLRAHDFAHCPDLWHQSRLANVNCVWSWRLCGINPVLHEASSRGI